MLNILKLQETASEGLHIYIDMILFRCFVLTSNDLTINKMQLNTKMLAPSEVNLMMIFFFLNENICCNPSLEWSGKMVLMRNHNKHFYEAI